MTPPYTKIAGQNAIDLRAEARVLQQGISLQSAQRREKLWKFFYMGVAAVVVFFLVKNQLWPELKRYF